MCLMRRKETPPRLRQLILRLSSGVSFSYVDWPTRGSPRCGNMSPEQEILRSGMETLSMYTLRWLYLFEKHHGMNKDIKGVLLVGWG